MKVMIDTNVILDVLLKREPFVDNAVKLFEQAEKNLVETSITANSVTDIIYILRKAYSLAEIKKHLQKMFVFIKIASVTAGDIKSALKFDIPDFENALLMQCAKRTEADLIITRNKKDFEKSPVDCLNIDEWVDRFYQGT